MMYSARVELTRKDNDDSADRDCIMTVYGDNKCQLADTVRALMDSWEANE